MRCNSVAVPQPQKYPWYALRTRPNHEKTAATVLAAKGYEFYLPSYKVRRRWSDRTVETTVPLFPGYLFCRFDSRLRRPIIVTPGVVSVVSFGTEPIAVPDSEIDAVETILASGLAAESCGLLQDGDRVRITRGFLEGLEGILLKKKSEWRFVVSVTLLQRSVSVEIDREWIAAVAPAGPQRALAGFA